MKKKNNQSIALKWAIMISVIVVLGIFSTAVAGIVSLFMNDGAGYDANTAIIPIHGVISVDKDSSLMAKDIASSTEIIKQIKKAEKNNNIKAVIFDINSPGGSAVASDEIAEEIKKLHKLNKTTVAWIREIGTSGAYWIASSCDYVVANKMSLTGSIGVIASYLEFSGFLHRYNISYERLVSGEYKDIGSPFRKMTDQEKAIFQKQLDKIHELFIEEVAKNRNLPKENISFLANGLPYLGYDALDKGLIDKVGGYDDVVDYIEQKQNITVNAVKYEQKKGFFDLLFDAYYKKQFFLGQGIASGINENPELQAISYR